MEIKTVRGKKLGQLLSRGKDGDGEDSMLYREFKITKKNIDEEKRTVDLSFSSEEPYERWFGFEILGHKPGEIRLERIETGLAPFLKDHDRNIQIGVIESVTISGDKGRAIVRFSKRQVAEDEFCDVVDGIRGNISVGYIVHEAKLISSTGGVDSYRVTDWEPMEISLVSIPADTTVGVGRGNDNIKSIINMNSKGKNSMSDPKEPENTFTADSIKNARADERLQAEREYKESLRLRDENTRGIIDIGDRLQMSRDAMNFIKEGKSLDEFKNFAMEELEKRSAKPPVSTPRTIGMSEKDQDKYSFMRVVRAVCLGPKDPRFIREAAFEFECAEAAAKIQGKAPDGLIVPHDMLTHKYQSRTLTAGTATDGAELVGSNLLAGSFIDVLRNLSVAMSLGARVLNGLEGNVLIPRKTSGSSAAWITTEGGNAANSEAQFDQVSLTPKTAGVYTDLSRQLLMQSTPAAEALIRDDLAMGMGTLLDLACFYATGANGQPTGISVQTGINAPTAFAAAVPTWAEVVAMESAVAVDNALSGSLGYVMEPAMRGSLKTTPKESGYPVYIMGEDGKTLNGYTAKATSQITSGDLFFGNFLDLLIGFWGGLDILVDPYTNSLSGTVRLVAHQSMDIAVRHPVSFAFNNDGA
jgi:HK97 family phage major capsid protein